MYDEHEDLEEEDEIVRELLDDVSPLFVVPQSAGYPTNGIGSRNSPCPSQQLDNDDVIRRLVSAVYSGPTIQDIEAALNGTTHKGCDQYRLGSSLTYRDKFVSMTLKSL